MKNSFLINVFSSQYGTILRLATSAIVWVIVALTSYFGLNLSGDTVALLSSLAAAMVAGAIGEYILKDARDGTKQMQTLLQPVMPEVTTDGRAGPVTIEAVAKVVEAAKSETPLAVTPPATVV